MAEDPFNILDRSDQNMSPQLASERSRPPVKDQNSMENGRTTKLYYERFISLENSMTRVVFINFFLLILYVNSWLK
jgi:hypothetical protein